jgi:hypothetical protein
MDKITMEISGERILPTVGTCVEQMHTYIIPCFIRKEKMLIKIIRQLPQECGPLSAAGIKKQKITYASMINEVKSLVLPLDFYERGDA